MPNIINRNALSGLIPEPVTREIMQGAIAESAVLRMGKRLANMSSKTQTINVLDALPSAYFVNGEATGDGHLTVTDAHFGVNPVDMEMEALLGKPPRMTRDVSSQPSTFVPFDAVSIELKDAAYRLMRLPTIAD